MELNKHNVQNYISKYAENVEKYTKSGTLDGDAINDLLSEFDNISAFLMKEKDVPAEVKEFLSEEYLNPKANIPEKYEQLKSIFKLRDYVKNTAESNIKKSLKKENYKEVFSSLSIAVRADIRNITMFESVIELFKRNDLHKKVIELFRMMFVYTLEPLYFEKIGDVFAETGKYQEAVDSYLNCAEYTDDYVEIYEKLADVFGDLNDNESRTMCLNQAKLIRGENG